MSYVKLGVLAVTAKGVVITALVTLLADIAFWKSLVLVLVSAMVTGVFVIAAAWITVRHTSQQLQGPITDIKQKIGADKRADDLSPQVAPGSPHSPPAAGGHDA